ncbi:MAG: dTDP-glucose 4,6-dehydratase [Rhodospirillales bacterium]|nr:dTDP-glucose 4,6-dehydratase [Rhodospirillales bacterium]
MAIYLVTGGAGFIGSKLVEDLLQRYDTVVVLDALTYSGRRENLAGSAGNQNLIFVEGSICDPHIVSFLIDKHQPQAFINVAAETHVDRSIDRPSDFIDTNISGTNNLLHAGLKYWQSMTQLQQKSFRYLQVSTDEVYGSIDSGAATESAPFKPNSPYAASKAAADHLVRSYNRTYGLPTLTTHGSNTYGPRQFPEKLIPLMILRALSGQSLPVYGDGKQVREWIAVNDHVAGIIAVLDRGKPGQSYNIGSGEELENVELVKFICQALNSHSANEPNKNFLEKIEFVQDRPGHDLRYSMDCSKAKTSLGWKCITDLNAGLVGVIDWYIDNKIWWEPIVGKQYELTRLGAPKK